MDSSSHSPSFMNSVCSLAMASALLHRARSSSCTGGGTREARANQVKGEELQWRKGKEISEKRLLNCMIEVCGGEGWWKVVPEAQD